MSEADLTSPQRWTRRPRFSANQLLSAEQLSTMLEGQRDQTAMLMRALHGHGVIFGFAVGLFEPHYAEKLSLAGTPEEVVEKIKADLEPAGVNHMIFSLADPALVKLFSGEDVPNVPDISGQLKLIAERVMPAFG